MLEIQTLVDLALSDRDITQLRNACKKLDMMIKTSREELDKHLAEKKKNQEELEIILDRRKEIQFKYELQDQLINKLETQVPNIRNQKEYVASKKQLEEGRKGRGQLEEMLLELDIRTEELQSVLDNLGEIIGGLDSKFHENAEPLIEIRQGNESKISQISNNHSELVANLPNPIRRFYDKCLSNRVLQPICFIVEKSCSGCNIMLQPQLVNELMVNPNSYKTCPHCSRVLVYQPPVEKETDAA